MSSIYEKAYPRSNATNQAQRVPANELAGVSSLSSSPRSSGRPSSIGHGSSLAQRHVASRGARGSGDSVPRGWALRSASRPELTQFLAQLLARGCPVGPDVITEVLDVALHVQLILFKPANVEFLARGTALELTRNVLLIITHDPIDAYTWSATAMRTEGSEWEPEV